MSSDGITVIGTMVQSITAIALGIFAYKQMNITDKQKEIAAQQSSILQAQNNLSLFEKRFKVYESLANLVAAGLRQADISYDDLRTFFQNTREAKFLFEEDLILYINSVLERCAQIHATSVKMKNTSDEKYMELVDQHGKDMEYLIACMEEIPQRFEKYISFKHIKQYGICFYS